MGGQQTSEDTDGGFEDLWPCVHVERNGLDDILDGRIKPLNIAHHNECVEDVNQCHGVISCNVIGSPVVTIDLMNNLIFAAGGSLTGLSSLGHVPCRILGPVRHRGKLTVDVNAVVHWRSVTELTMVHVVIETMIP